ncbi:MAG: aspartate/glutamate racemase family protein [Candidatus Bipolaricaulota bacterium]
MKRIGILGGMSPEATAEYYLHITRRYTERFGNCSYPEIFIHSVSFQPYIDWPAAGRWDLVADGLVEGARGLERAGADFLVIPANTMHYVLPQISPRIGIPILSLPDAVREEVASHGLRCVGLLGTRYTMELPFYGKVLGKSSIQVIVPRDEDRGIVDRTIYEELVFGQIRERSRQAFLRIIGDLVAQGAQAVILACTEIPLLIRPDDCPVPVFDSCRIHADAALEHALGE